MVFLRRLRLLVPCVLLGALAPGGRAEIEFVGVMGTPQSTRICLGDTTDGGTRWLTVGQTFAGHTLIAYDRATETVTLRREGVDLRVRLKDDAKVKAGRLELTGTITLGMSEPLQVVRATLQLDQENVFPLRDGVVCRVTPQRRPDGNILFRALFERTFPDGRTERRAAPAVISRPGAGFSVKVGELSFAFAPNP